MFWLMLCFLSLVGLPPVYAGAHPPCSHYASPGGTGDGSSMTQPLALNQFWPIARPGMVLCLADGVYQGSANMLTAPTTFAGTAAAPITIRAMTDGAVTIDGQDSRRPADLQGAFGILEGVNLTRGDNSNLSMRGTDWIARRIVSWNVGVAGDHNISVVGFRNLLEDCAAFGAARKQISAGSSGAGPRFNTIRRCWARWEANLHETSNPSMAFEMGYGQDAIWAENLLGTWDTQGRMTEPEGIFHLFATQDSTLLASIFYVVPGAVYSPNKVVFATSDAGSHYQAGDYHPTERARMAQLALWLPPDMATKESARFSKASQGPAGGPNWVDGLTAIGGLPPTFTSNWTPSAIRHGATLAEALSGTSLWALSPGLCHQMVGGVVTETPLWPWPMQERLSAALAQAGYPPVDLTAQMEALFGPIPASCRTTAPPTPEGEVVLELSQDGGTGWDDVATFPARPPSLCLRLRADGQTSTRLCLDQPTTRQPVSR